MITNQIWRARLNPSSPRYIEWRKIFDSDEIPMMAPMVITAFLGTEKDTIHLLDWQLMDEETSARLLAYMSDKFGIPEEEIENQLDDDGHFPIRTSDVIISFDERCFI